MNLRPVLCALLFLLMSVPAIAGEYRTVDFESLHVTLDSEWSTQAAPGYWPVRLDITNFGEDRVIEVYGRGDRWWRSGESENHPTDGSPEAGDRQRFTVSVPTLAITTASCFNASATAHCSPFTYADFSNKSLDETTALIVADPASTLGPKRRAGPSGAGRAGLPYASCSLAFDELVSSSIRNGFPPTGWDLHRCVPSSVQGVVPAERSEEALLTWTACGGDLMFVDGDLDTPLPDPRADRLG
jgi:hypothetical protein